MSSSFLFPFYEWFESIFLFDLSLTNRKRRSLYSEGNSHGTSQQLTMELASLVFLQFQHGLKMANTLWLRGGVDHCFACLPRTQHKQSQSGLCETYLYRDFASSLPPVLFSDKIFIDIFHCSPRWFLFICWCTLVPYSISIASVDSATWIAFLFFCWSWICSWVISFEVIFLLLVIYISTRKFSWGRKAACAQIPKPGDWLMYLLVI